MCLPCVVFVGVAIWCVVLCCVLFLCVLFRCVACCCMCLLCRRRWVLQWTDWWLLHTLLHSVATLWVAQILVAVWLLQLMTALEFS